MQVVHSLLFTSNEGKQIYLKLNLPLPGYTSPMSFIYACPSFNEHIYCNAPANGRAVNSLRRSILFAFTYYSHSRKSDPLSGLLLCRQLVR